MDIEVETTTTTSVSDIAEGVRDELAKRFTPAPLVYAEKWPAETIEFDHQMQIIDSTPQEALAELLRVFSREPNPKEGTTYRVLVEQLPITARWALNAVWQVK